MTISKSKKKFTLDVSWVFMGMVIIFFLHFFQNPILARFLGPDGLGLFSMTTIIAGFVISVVGYGVNATIVKYVAEYKDNKPEINAIVSSGLLAMIILGSGLSGILFILSDSLACLFNMPSLSFLLKIYAFIFPFSLAYEVIMGLFNGLREMKYHSFITIFQGVLTFSFILTFLFWGFGVEGALAGMMLAVMASLGISAIIMRKLIHFAVSKNKKIIKKLVAFSSRLMLANSMTIINNQVAILLIGYFMTATDVGYYAVAVSFSRFFWRIPESMQRIAYPATSDYWAKSKFDSLNKMIDKSMKYSACLLLIVGLGTWFFAKDIVVFLFGDVFIHAVLPLQILVIGTVLFGIYIPIGSTLPGIGRPDLSFKIGVVAATASVVLNILLIPRIGITGAALATISSFIILAVLSIYFIIKLTKIKIDVRWFTSAFTITFLAMAVFYATSEWINEYIIGSIILCIYASIIFLFFFTKEDKEIFKDLIRSIIPKRFG